MTVAPIRYLDWITTSLCVVLAAGWLYSRHLARQKEQQHAARIGQLSNSWQRVSQKLEEQTVVNRSLELELNALVKERDTYSHEVRTLSQRAAARTSDPESATAASAELLRRDSRIQQLESERDNLAEELNELTRSIADVQTQVAETQRRLNDSEGDREYLMQELKRLQAEKSKLQHQFSQVAALRQQLHKLREERAISRRIEWTRRGVYGNTRGGELLRKGFAATQTAPANFNLDVEVPRIGEAKVLTGP